MASILNASLEEQDPGIALARLQQERRDKAARDLALQSLYPHQLATAVTAPEVSSLDEDLKANPYSDEAAAARTKLNEQVATRNRPDVAALEERDIRNKVRENEAQAVAQAAGSRDVAKINQAGETERLNLENERKQKLYDMLGLTGQGGGGGKPGGATAGSALGVPGSFKPSINAQGEVTFSENTMPALVQRAHAQLGAAREQTLNALQEAERMYPGINEAADQSESQQQSPGWLSLVTGAGAPKYGSMKDMAGAANERLKYSLGVPTPFSNMAQESSFANLEQMAGQLPGVRGLATITPMFREHQSRWGKETPLATVQRLRRMAAIMDDTISGMERGQ